MDSTTELIPEHIITNQIKNNEILLNKLATINIDLDSIKDKIKNGDGIIVLTTFNNGSITIVLAEPATHKNGD
ncbi:hypothetical protein [Alphaentomopoxvirus acuprea]|uniref:Uncharacterized protein n=1 Tax=Alphaentomopoxvirus acuprea TaxID=62099 RepID=W6JKT4_9POXV|nr:hypothetical protein BA82_gp030 [Anomala cuprea entomopoxvirus]BAO49390.1 hypothetical protein [Anomala cuprea entomopoxvirus]